MLKKRQDRVAIVIMSGGKDSRIGVPRATLRKWFGISDGIRAAHD